MPETRFHKLTYKQAADLIDRCWETGPFLAFTTELGLACGLHLCTTEEHTCCVETLGKELADKIEQGLWPANDTEAVCAIRDDFETSDPRCQCCKIVHEVCTAVLRENERRITLAMMAEAEKE